MFIGEKHGAKHLNRSNISTIQPNVIEELKTISEDEFQHALENLVNNNYIPINIIFSANQIET